MYQESINVLSSLFICSTFSQINIYVPCNQAWALLAQNFTETDLNGLMKLNNRNIWMSIYTTKYIVCLIF